MAGRPNIGKSKRAYHAIGVAVIFVAILLSAGALFYNYASDQVYRESMAQLDELSDQLFEKLESRLDLQWEYLDKFKDNCTQTSSLTLDELSNYIAHCEDDFSTDGSTYMFRAIDSEGSYYTRDGRQGQWSGLNNIDDADEKHSFLIENTAENRTYMAFVMNGSGSITVDGHEITHFVLLRSVEEMQPFFHSSAFGDSNLVFLVNPDGLILFEDGSLEGLDVQGTNIFYIMEEMEFPHEESLDTFLAQSESDGKDCTDVRHNGRNYYVVYNYLPTYDWGMLLFVSADDVASTTENMVWSMMVIFLVILGVLLALLAVAVFSFARFDANRKLLAVKVESEQKLAAANKTLEDYNDKLQEKQAEVEAAMAEAVRATKAKSSFLANMSHDIRTPMNAIVGLTELMECDLSDREKMLTYIHKLRTSSSYMLGLINDILDMSKIESGEVGLNLEPLKMAEQAGQIESIIRSQSNERTQTLDVVVHEIAHEYLIGDSIRVRQIFINLLNNAVKYTQAGGSIRFEIREVPCSTPGYASFVTSVVDDGCGMSAEYLEHIFEPFTREESSLTNKVQGTGLGMSITKSLVDLMGGTITVESEIGRGTRFDVTLTLPIDYEAYKTRIVDSVILISSEPQMIANMKASFREPGIEPRVAKSVGEAAQMVREQVPDVVLVSGKPTHDELASAVKMLREAANASAAGADVEAAGADSETGAAPSEKMLVFCCDYAHRQEVHEVMRGSGIDGFVARPFFLENLATAVHNARANENPLDDERRSPLKGKKFLCAEDNELNAEILEALLAMHNASCVICSNGEEIVEAFRDVKPGDFDAILMDVQMPKMDGLEATRAIRSGSNELGRTIPIIAMTANAFNTDVIMCLEAGMDAHLAKPIDIALLERILHEILSKNAGGASSLS